MCTTFQENVWQNQKQRDFGNRLTVETEVTKSELSLVPAGQNSERLDSTFP